jgi:hypothetical protein
LGKFYKVYKILLSPAQEELMDRIMAIFNNLKKSVGIMALSREFPPADEAERIRVQEALQTSLAEARAQFHDVYPVLKVQLERDFRATLGLDISEKILLDGPSRRPLSAQQLARLCENSGLCHHRW